MSGEYIPQNRLVLWHHYFKHAAKASSADQNINQKTKEFLDVLHCYFLPLVPSDTSQLLSGVYIWEWISIANVRMGVTTPLP
jgi:hypothetical protein